MTITPGSRWLEKDTGRVIVVLSECVHDTGPSWRYEDEPADDPNNWHYCDVLDFVVWGRFEPIP